MNQGDVYWYTFKQPDKRRPVVVLTRDRAIPYLSSVIVAPITTTIRSIPTEVLITTKDGMPDVCVVNVDNLQTVDKVRLEKFVTHLSDEVMTKICLAVEYALGFERYLNIDTE